MANTAVPNGFVPASLMSSGTAPNYGLRALTIAYNYGTQIGRGDPVKLASGLVNVMPVGDSNTIIGIFWGCEYWDPTNGIYQRRPSWPAPSGLVSTQTVTAFVYTETNMVFMGQSTGTITVANRGQFLDITSGTSGAPNSVGISTCSLGPTPAGTNTRPFIVEDVVPSGAFTNFGNLQAGTPALYDSTQANNWVFVRMNKLATAI